jgi:hypothetical protein
MSHRFFIVAALAQQLKIVEVVTVAVYMVNLIGGGAAPTTAPMITIDCGLSEGT